MDYRFSQLFDWCSGKADTSTGGDIPIYGSNGVIGYTSTAKYYNKIILGRVGAYCGSVEYCAGPFSATDNTLITTCDESKILYQFAYYLLKHFRLNDFAGGSAQPLITQSILRHLHCNIPEISQQKFIANVLSSYDNLIENNNKRIAILEQMAEVLYGHTFSTSNIECDSTEVYLGQFIKLVRGLSYTSDEIDVDNGVNLINLKNIQAFGGFRTEGLKLYGGQYKQEQIVKHGDLVMGVTDMTQERRLVGSVALVPMLKNTSVFSADLVKIESTLDNIFLYSMFKYGDISRYISQFANGANVLHLKPQTILKIRIELPPQELICRYVALIKPLFSKIEKLNNVNDNLAKQRNMLLPRLINGTLEIKL